jgi:hypothetical protein
MNEELHVSRITSFHTEYIRNQAISSFCCTVKVKRKDLQYWGEMALRLGSQTAIRQGTLVTEEMQVVSVFPPLEDTWAQVDGTYAARRGGDEGYYARFPVRRLYVRSGIQSLDTGPMDAIVFCAVMANAWLARRDQVEPALGAIDGGARRMLCGYWKERSVEGRERLRDVYVKEKQEEKRFSTTRPGERGFGKNWIELVAQIFRLIPQMTWTSCLRPASKDGPMRIEGVHSNVKLETSTGAPDEVHSIVRGVFAPVDGDTPRGYTRVVVGGPPPTLLLTMEDGVGGMTPEYLDAIREFCVACCTGTEWSMTTYALSGWLETTCGGGDVVAWWKSGDGWLKYSPNIWEPRPSDPSEHNCTAQKCKSRIYAIFFRRVRCTDLSI